MKALLEIVLLIWAASIVTRIAGRFTRYVYHGTMDLVLWLWMPPARRWTWRDTGWVILLHLPFFVLPYVVGETALWIVGYPSLLFHH